MIEISTRDYELAHARKPRGFGSWAFTFNGDEWLIDDVFWVHQSTYGQAKRVAIVEAKRRGKRRVFVCS